MSLEIQSPLFPSWFLVLVSSPSLLIVFICLKVLFILYCHCMVCFYPNKNCAVYKTIRTFIFSSLFGQTHLLKKKKDTIVTKNIIYIQEMCVCFSIYSGFLWLAPWLVPQLCPECKKEKWTHKQNMRNKTKMKQKISPKAKSKIHKKWWVGHPSNKLLTHSGFKPKSQFVLTILFHVISLMYEAPDFLSFETLYGQICSNNSSLQ